MSRVEESIRQQLNPSRNSRNYGSTQIQNNDSSPIDSEDQLTYPTTKRRWLILTAFFIFSLIVSVVENEYSILRTVTSLLGFTVDQYVYIGIIYGQTPLFTILPIAWGIDKIGLRPVLYIAAITMAFRSSFKALLYLPNLPYWNNLKVFYWFFGRVLGLQLELLIWTLPMKISEQWFTDTERSTAWAIMTTSVLIGSSVSSFIYPRLVKSYNSVEPLAYISIICGIISIITIFSLVTKSTPKYPPNERTSLNLRKKQDTYLETLKKIIRHKDLLLNSLHTAIFEGVFIAFSSVQQDIMLASGHSEIFVGNLMALNSFIGLVFMIFLSLFIHRIKNIVFACKFGSLTKTILFIACTICILIPMDNWILITITIIYAIWKSWMLPNFINMTSHLAFGYISEASAASIQTTFIIITVTISQLFFISLKKEKNDVPDYSRSVIFSGVVGLLNSLLYIIFFQGKRQEIICDNIIDNRNNTNGQDVGREGTSMEIS